MPNHPATLALADLALLVVAGKGGVGRSTVAAALALSRVEAGGRVLAIDVLADGGLQRALDYSTLGALGPGELSVLELSTEAALKEFVGQSLRLPFSPTGFAPLAAIFDFVATAAPGVREILTIGKVAEEVRQGKWDLVVVDGPATGHCIELLAAPDSMREMVGFGPMAEHSKWISEILGNQATTGAVVVTQPEETPVSEAIELLDRLRTETNVNPVGLVANRVPPLLSKNARRQAMRLVVKGSGMGAGAEVLLDHSETAKKQLERLDAISSELWSLRVDLVDDPVAEVVKALDELLAQQPR